jgi:hypothetical protein
VGFGAGFGAAVGVGDADGDGLTGGTGLGAVSVGAVSPGAVSVGAGAVSDPLAEAKPAGLPRQRRAARPKAAPVIPIVRAGLEVGPLRRIVVALLGRVTLSVTMYRNSTNAHPRRVRVVTTVISRRATVADSDRRGSPCRDAVARRTRMEIPGSGGTGWSVLRIRRSTPSRSSGFDRGGG